MAKIIYLEGPKGCGKSTLLARLEVTLVEAGITVHKFNEPGGDADTSPMGIKIRELVKFGGDRHVTTTSLLMQAARNELYQNSIKPLLDDPSYDNDVIIVDRSILSALTYQYVLGKCEVVPDLFKLTTPEYIADLAVWMLPSVETLTNQLTMRDGNVDNINDKNEPKLQLDGYSTLRYNLNTFDNTQYYKDDLSLTDESLDEKVDIVTTRIKALLKEE